MEADPASAGANCESLDDLLSKLKQVSQKKQEEYESKLKTCEDDLALSQNSLQEAHQIIAERESEVKCLSKTILEHKNESEEKSKEIVRLRNLLVTTQNQSKRKLTAIKKNSNSKAKKNQDLFLRFLKSIKSQLHLEGNLEADMLTDAKLNELTNHISEMAKSWKNDKEELRRLQHLEDKIEKAFSTIPGAHYKRTVDLPTTSGDPDEQTISSSTLTGHMTVHQETELQNHSLSSNVCSSGNEQARSSSARKRLFPFTSVAPNSSSSPQPNYLEPKFICECKSRFISLYGLKRHMKQVHRIKNPLSHYNYGCRLCGTMMIDWVGLRFHQKSVHNVPRRNPVLRCKTRQVGCESIETSEIRSPDKWLTKEFPGIFSHLDTNTNN